MIMKRLVTIYLLLAASFVCAQEKTWKEINSFNIVACEAWDVDPMGKVIFSNNDVIVKLDSSFNVQFRESIKSIGRITSIDARHALKTLVFSEEQQVISFLDNTLASHKGVKDLSRLDISYGTHVSYSGQSNRYWIFDGDNSKLVLVDESRQRPQVLENLAGIIGTIEVNQIIEMENILFVFDKNKGIYLFDIYGSLIDLMETTDAISIHYFDGFVYYLTDKELVRWHVRSREKRAVNLPKEGIKGFRVLGNYIFFRTNSHIKKYRLFQLD